MRTSLLLTLCTLTALSACARVAESRLNPFNWFQAATVTAPRDASGNLRPLVDPNAQVRIVDGRAAVDTVTGLRIDRNPDGAIVTATGTAPTGAFNAELVPIAQDGGTLTLAFRVENAGTTGAQPITVARLLSSAELAGVRRIVVQGARNSASSAR